MNRKQYMLFFISFFTIELIFRLQAHTLAVNALLLRSFIFSLFMAAVFTVINSLSQSKYISIFTVLMMFIYDFYALFQIGMFGYYESFFSSRFLNKEIPQVQSYAMDFIKFLRIEHFSYVLLFILFTYFYLNNRKKSYHNQKAYSVRKSLATGLLFFVMYVALLFYDPVSYIESSVALFKNPYYTENAINQLGLIAFMQSDLQYIFFPSRAIQKLEIDKPVEKPVEKPTEDPTLRKIDDTQWYKIMTEESNAAYKTLDQYYLSQPVSKKNEMTGIFKDKNLVYFLVEALDKLAIHPQLTPTLYQLKMEGLYFNNFHSPQFNCATAESELISQVSMYPVIGTCTMASYYESAQPQSLYNLFAAKGYITSAFHNWNDQFYPRTEILPVLGAHSYKDVSDTIPRLISGWQSDLTMMHTVVQDLNSLNQPFMSHVLTSSTHFPYDKASALGDRYQSKIRAVIPNVSEEVSRYLSKAMELDLAIRYLMDNLEDMDNTVLILYSDHTPFRISVKDVYRFRSDDNPGRFKDSTPMIIYTPGITQKNITTVSSTMDLAPTIANLFDLDYDPRLFMGTDIFSDTLPLVIFQSGSWVDDVGEFSASKGVFTPYDSNKLYTDQELESRLREAKTKLSVSSQTYLNDYFKARSFLKP